MTHALCQRIQLRFSVKLYQRRDINETLSSTLEIVLRQVSIPIPQSKILQREYRKRENLLFSSLSGLYLF